MTNTEAGYIRAEGSYRCEKCGMILLPSERRYYPGSGVAKQPEMHSVCRRCEAILSSEVMKALAAAPQCCDCHERTASYDGVRCWPCQTRRAA